jgi:ABC-type nitrate/sulfonate/bicarbonate transport system permease component
MTSTEIKRAPTLIPGVYQTRIASIWRKHRSLGLTVLSLLLGFAGWQLLSTFVFSPFLVPPPVRVIKTAIPMILSGEILRDAIISLSRVFVGFVAGSITAILLGVILGRISTLHDLVDPVVELLRYLSPTAMIPIAVIWFGIGEMSKYFLIFWGTFFIMLVNTTAGVLRTPLARQRAGQCLGASQLEIFAYIVVPSAVPYIITGMRVAMASAFMSIIPAEILAADSGIGYLLQNSSMLLQTDRIFVALLTISVLGFLCDRTLRLIVDLTLKRFTVPA